MSLSHLLYVSDAVQAMDDAALEALIAPCRNKNHRLGVTGVLFYSAGHFIQLLEGERSVVRSLFDTIRKDPRHRDVQLLLLRTIPQRVFADWSMGVLNMDQCSDLDREALDEIVRLAEWGGVSDEPTPLSLKLLSRFCMMLPRQQPRQTPTSS